MDESGIHDGAHVCVLAGYWGSLRKWEQFEAEWKKILRNANEPTLTEFHSTEFWHGNGTRKGVFALWSDTRADQFIGDLADCIVGANLFPTIAMLVVDEWNRLNRWERMFLTGGQYDPVQKKWLTSGAPKQTYFPALPVRRH